MAACLKDEGAAELVGKQVEKAGEQIKDAAQGDQR